MDRVRQSVRYLAPTETFGILLANADGGVKRRQRTRILLIVASVLVVVGVLGALGAIGGLLVEMISANSTKTDPKYTTSFEDPEVQTTTTSPTKTTTDPSEEEANDSTTNPKSLESLTQGFAPGPGAEGGTANITDESGSGTGFREKWEKSESGEGTVAS